MPVSNSHKIASLTCRSKPHKKIFRALIRSAPQQLTDETKQIVDSPNQEDELKQVLDINFDSKKKRLKRKRENVQEADTLLDPTVSSTPSTSTGTTTTSLTKPLTKASSPKKKKKSKEKKVSIFDNY